MDVARLMSTKQRKSVYLCIQQQYLQDNYLPLPKALFWVGFIFGERIYKTSPSSSKIKNN